MLTNTDSGAGVVSFDTQTELFRKSNLKIEGI